MPTPTPTPTPAACGPRDPLSPKHTNWCGKQLPQPVVPAAKGPENAGLPSAFKPAPRVKKTKGQSKKGNPYQQAMTPYIAASPMRRMVGRGSFGTSSAKTNKTKGKGKRWSVGGHERAKQRSLSTSTRSSRRSGSRSRSRNRATSRGGGGSNNNRPHSRASVGGRSMEVARPHTSCGGRPQSPAFRSTSPAGPPPRESTGLASTAPTLGGAPTVAADRRPRTSCGPPRVARLAQHDVADLSKLSADTLTDDRWMGRSVSTPPLRGVTPVKAPRSRRTSMTDTQAPSCAAERFSVFKPLGVLNAIADVCGTPVAPDTLGFLTMAGVVEKAANATKEQLVALLAHPAFKGPAAMLKLTADALAPGGASAGRAGAAIATKADAEGTRRAQVDLLVKQAVEQEKALWRKSQEAERMRRLYKRQEEQVGRSDDWNHMNERLQTVLLRENQVLVDRRQELLRRQEVAEERRQKAVMAREQARTELRRRGQHRDAQISSTVSKAAALRELRAQEAKRRLETKERLHERAKQELHARHQAALRERRAREDAAAKQVHVAQARRRRLQQSMEEQLRAKEDKSKEASRTVTAMQQSKADAAAARWRLQQQRLQTFKLQAEAQDKLAAMLDDPAFSSGAAMAELERSRQRVACETNRLRLLDKHGFDSVTEKERDVMPGPGQYPCPSTLDGSSGALISDSVILNEFSTEMRRAKDTPGPGAHLDATFRSNTPLPPFSQSTETWLTRLPKDGDHMYV